MVLNGRVQSKRHANSKRERLTQLQSAGALRNRLIVKTWLHNRAIMNGIRDSDLLALCAIGLKVGFWPISADREC